MKIYLFLGLILLFLSTYSLINPKHDNLLLPIIEHDISFTIVKTRLVYAEGEG